MSTLSKLLIRNVSKGQTIAYLVANFIGLSIILCAVQLHSDLAPAMDRSGEDGSSYLSDDYLIITKRLSSLSAIGGDKSRFTPQELDDIASQPWARKTGSFNSADFSVEGAVSFGGSGISSAMFLESVPDEFIDRKPEGWDYDTTAISDYSKAPVPVIIQRDYLALYNFGFAPSRGLPQLSDEMVKSAPLSLIMSGNGHKEVFPARIVGFSDRLNTISVPEKFLTWANNRYSTPVKTGGHVAQGPARLIIATTSAGDPKVEQYLEDQRYEAAGNNIESGKASFFLTVITAIIAGIGAIISILAIIILLLSVFLLIQKNKLKIHQLMTLGFSPMSISKYYFKIIGIVNLAVLALSMLTVWLLSTWWSGLMSSLDICGDSLWPSLISGVIAIAAITIFNFLIVARMVRKCFRDNS